MLSTAKGRRLLISGEFGERVIWTAVALQGFLAARAQATRREFIPWWLPAKATVDGVLTLLPVCTP